MPGFTSEGKTRLTIAIGCTGGYHRSIVMAEELREWLGSAASARSPSSTASSNANEAAAGFA